MNSNTGGVKNRKKSALQRLQEQLELGAKTPKSSYGDFKEKLTDSDIARINKEIVSLENWLKSN